jgi:hypothetical protein
MARGPREEAWDGFSVGRGDKQVKIYKVQYRDEFEFCQPVTREDFRVVHSAVLAEEAGRAWTPIEVEIIREDEGEELLESDAPWFTAHALVFGTSAVRVMGRTLREYGELLPLVCKDRELILYKVGRVLDALDLEQSLVLRTSKGKMFDIKQYSLIADRIGDTRIFHLSALRSSTYVGEGFVEQWKAAGLRGFHFDLVWSNE